MFWGATDTDRSVNESKDLLDTVAIDTDRSVNESTDLLVTVANNHHGNLIKIFTQSLINNDVLKIN